MARQASELMTPSAPIYHIDATILVYSTGDKHKPSVRQQTPHCWRHSPVWLPCVSQGSWALLVPSIINLNIGLYRLVYSNSNKISSRYAHGLNKKISDSRENNYDQSSYGNGALRARAICCCTRIDSCCNAITPYQLSKIQTHCVAPLGSNYIPTASYQWKIAMNKKKEGLNLPRAIS